METLPTQYQHFIYLSRYSRFLWDEMRRETLEETVNRYFNFFEELLLKRCNYVLTKLERNTLQKAVYDLDVMPSMRALSTAGEALSKDEIAGYNCSFVAVDNARVFDEILYVLMCGTGVGFSVEQHNILQLPTVNEEFFPTETCIIVRDSKIGWAKALKELVFLLYSGQIPSWDLSKLRPSGAPLKTFGGRSSGPDPLDELFVFIVNMFKNAAGRKLNSIECHDFICKIGDVVVSGGVRRSALISISDLFEERMRVAKTGQWWENNVHRALANNSACYLTKPDIGVFLEEWKSLYESKSGERGIFNRYAAKEQAAKNGRRDTEFDFGTNPCGEIILRSKEFCNLTEVVVRENDTYKTLVNKVEIATILGTFQSSLTNFRYLRKDWKANCIEERLLGVSLTGIMDNILTSTNGLPLETLLDNLKQVSIETNKVWADKLGIEISAAITCVKPSGTVGQLVDAAPGIHPRYSQYYIRTVRADKTDPLANMMIDIGFSCEEDVTKPDRVYVFSFPTKAPENAVLRNDRTAIEQLELWKTYRNYWCEHNPSITVYVKEHEWVDVAAWVYKNFNDICGITLLPHTEHIYKQAPYQEITEEEYIKLEAEMPKNVDWSKLKEYENTDHTEGSSLTACIGGVCEIVDLVK